MGYDLHITRAAHWADNEDSQIAAEEWLALVEADPQLKLQPENGDSFAEWISEDAGPDGAWFDWFHGNIYTKWPSQATFGKMLKIAKQLRAKVQGDDGEVYRNFRDWKRYFEDGSKGGST